MATALDTPRNVFAKRECKVPVIQKETEEKLNKLCFDVLASIGFQNVAQWVASISYMKKKAIENFQTACQEESLPIKWEHSQVQEFMIRIDKLYFSASVIKMYWKLIKDVSRKMNFLITEVETTLHDFILAWCKPTKDDKLPVTRKLLIKLCNAAPKVLQGYDVILVRALFICAFGGFMRTCKYTAARAGRVSHNLHDDSIHITEDGIGITFRSDKTAYIDPTPKHRIVWWNFLFPEAQAYMLAYNNARLRDTGFYFLHEDG